MYYFKPSFITIESAGCCLYCMHYLFTDDLWIAIIGIEVNSVLIKPVKSIVLETYIFNTEHIVLM